MCTRYMKSILLSYVRCYISKLPQIVLNFLLRFLRYTIFRNKIGLLLFGKICFSHVDNFNKHARDTLVCRCVDLSDLNLYPLLSLPLLPEYSRAIRARSTRPPEARLPNYDTFLYDMFSAGRKDLKRTAMSGGTD